MTRGNADGRKAAIDSAGDRILSMAIDNLSLPARVFNALKEHSRRQCRTVMDLVSLVDEHGSYAIWSVRNLGTKSRAALRTALEEVGAGNELLDYLRLARVSQNAHKVRVMCDCCEGRGFKMATPIRVTGSP